MRALRGTAPLLVLLNPGQRGGLAGISPNSPAPIAEGGREYTHSGHQSQKGRENIPCARTVRRKHSFEETPLSPKDKNLRCGLEFSDRWTGGGSRGGEVRFSRSGIVGFSHGGGSAMVVWMIH
eukprot:4402367-Pyramimonas_sp.AAC.1